MLPRALPALLAVCLLPLACTVTTAHADDNEPRPNIGGNSNDAQPVEAEPEPAAVPADELVNCPTDERAIAVYCTDAGKLAGRWVPVDKLKIPDDVEIIFNAEGPDTTMQSRLLIATRGDELYIEHVTCGACRRVLGQGFAGRLAHMSEAQIRELQAQLGLDAAMPVLATTEQWTSFCSDERGSDALTRIAAKAEGDSGGR